MKSLPCALAIAISLAAAVLPCRAAPTPFPGVTTWHNDNARTGQYLQETTLTPANVNASTFGRKFTQPVDGYIFAQPLYVHGVQIATSKGPVDHNVVYVATEHDSVYAFDADSNGGVASKPLWKVSLGNSVATPNPYFGNRYGPYTNIYPEIGITGTPVIDRSTGTLYVDAFTEDAAGGPYHHILHALDITSGADKVTPVEIAGSVPGTGDASDGTNVAFNPEQQMQRPGLLLSNGMIYVAFGSYADTDPYHGWIFAYNASTLAQLAIFNTSPNGSESALWMAGAGLAADSDGNLFVSTANGTYDNNGDYGDTILELPPTLSNGLPYDYFTPFNQLDLANNDEDLGSGGVLLLPDQTDGAPTHLLVTAGKQGSIYLVNRDDMGGFNNSFDNVLFEFPNEIGGVWGSPAYWNGNIYYWGQYDVLKSFPISDGSLGAPTSSNVYAGYPAGTPAVSADGTLNGIVWAIQSDGGDTQQTPETLHAFDATDVTNELYNSNQAPGGRDIPGNIVKFAVPTIAWGKVYVGAEYQLSVYGLNPSAIVDTPQITPSPVDDLGAPVSMTDTTPGSKIYYTLDGATPVVGNKDTFLYSAPFTPTQCATVNAIGVETGMLNSLVASIQVAQPDPPATGNGLIALYYNNMTLSGTPVERIDPNINFGWANNIPMPGIGPNNWSCHWTGEILPPFTDRYTFTVVCDDGARLWVDGKLIVDAWYDQGATAHTGTIVLHGNKRYTIRMDYYQDGGATAAQLYWQGGCLPLQIVPQDRLYSPTQELPSPVISPGSQQENGPVQVSITDSVSDTVLYYTTDGTTPTKASNIYNGQFTVPAGTTVQAFAFKRHWIASPVVSTVYTEALPSPWQDTDIGAVGQPGNGSYANGTFYQGASGTDIWGYNDQLNYIYQPLTGDGSITAEVDSVDYTDQWAKAGVMIRGSLSDSSAQAMTDVTPGNGVVMQDRLADGQASNSYTLNGSTAPYWVRITRSGNNITGSASPDGVNWTPIQTDTVSLPSTAYVGLCLTAHNNSLFNNATFSNVTVATSP